jgi:hypothetical protein
MIPLENVLSTETEFPFGSLAKCLVCDGSPTQKCAAKKFPFAGIFLVEVDVCLLILINGKAEEVFESTQILSNIKLYNKISKDEIAKYQTISKSHCINAFRLTCSIF